MSAQHYKKTFVFLVATALKDITHSSLKLPKTFSQIPFKANTSNYFNTFLYSVANKTYKKVKLTKTKRIKENLKILQINRLSNS